MDETPKLNEYLHVCTTDSAAGAIKWMFLEKIHAARPPVLWSGMMENVGPIALLGQPRERFDWFIDVGLDLHIYMGYSEEGPEALIGFWQSFWAQIDAWNGPILYWFSSLSAQDRSLLLSLHRRIGETRPIFLVDVGHPREGQTAVTSPGELSPENLLLRIPQAQRLRTSLKLSLNESYASFASQPKVLRLLSGDILCEATIETADARILTSFSPEWAPLRRIMASIPGAFGIDGFRDLDYTWLLWRVNELCNTGRIERRGGAFDPQFRDDPFLGDARLST
ncbi:MAG: hypothetical protein C0456_01120 [Hyphomonas sp.]|uniref:DUF3658 domain-containing protein n=1 Tax=Hyphomonas sp. TaxID=87 RepID=UPI001DC017F8|nr:DUF3658 domain-containing protein [Hyphomonas sp.]MBA4225204.1 hypothetical protein [Hyphomonas sp.]